MYLKKKVKKIGSGIAATILIGIFVFIPMQGLAASEAVSTPVSTMQGPSGNVDAAPISEVLPSQPDSSVSVDAQTTESIPTPAENIPSTVMGATNSAAESTTVDVSSTPAQDVTGESIPGETLQASEGASVTPQQTDAQQGGNALPLLVVLIALVIIVAVVVAVSSAVSSVAAAVDDEEE